MARSGPVDPRLLRYARGSRGFLALTVLTSLVQVGCTIAFAWLLTSAITGVIDRGVDEQLWRSLAALTAVVVVRACVVWANERISAGAAATVGSELRTAFVDAIRRLGPGWVARQNSSSLAVTAGHGLEALDVYIGRFLPQLVATVVITPILVAVMWFSDWPSGLTVLVALPLIPLFMVLIGLATRTVQQRQWRTLQRLAARFADTVEGLGTLRLFGRERRAVASIGAVTDDYRAQTMKVLRITFLSGFMLEFLSSIAVAIIAVAIGLRLLDGNMALSVGLFVLLLAPEAFLPVRNVGVQFHAASEGLAAMEDVFAVLDEAAPLEPAAVAGTTARRGVLQVDGLRVHRDVLLAPVSLRAEPGTITLLRGPSGAGKSSVIAALRGAAQYAGSATLDGTPVHTLAPADWLAWADQRPGLIAGSIASNVALGDAAPDADDIDWALRTAGADDLPAELELGVQGAGVSGGQAQRIAVARALYRWRHGASVLVLDEPSSALDADTEARLWANVRAVADAGATVVIVSHRGSATDIADTVVEIARAEVSA